MRPDPKKRLGTQPSQTPLGAMDAAFAGLDVPVAPDTRPEIAPPPPRTAPVLKLGRVVLRRERAHRGGKTVIVVDDFAAHLTVEFIENVARTLRAVCGCGGTIKDRQIELQGDQPAKVRAALEAEGFAVAGER